MHLPARADCPRCTNTTLPAGDTGSRQVTRSGGLRLLSQPCATSGQLGSAHKCVWVTWTGNRQPSTCYEDQCYAEVQLASGKQGWVALRACGAPGAPNLDVPPPGQVNTTACTRGEEHMAWRMNVLP